MGGQEPAERVPRSSEKVLGSEVIRRERSAGPTALGDTPPVSAAAAVAELAQAGGGARLCLQGLAGSLARC